MTLCSPSVSVKIYDVERLFALLQHTFSITQTCTFSVPSSGFVALVCFSQTWHILWEWQLLCVNIFKNIFVAHPGFFAHNFFYTSHSNHERSSISTEGFNQQKLKDLKWNNLLISQVRYYKITSNPSFFQMYWFWPKCDTYSQFTENQHFYI
jgi:predicted membrane protein